MGYRPQGIYTLINKCWHCLLHVTLCVCPSVKSFFPALSYLIGHISEIILMATKVIKVFSVCVPFSTFHIPLTYKHRSSFFSHLHPYSNPNESNLNTTWHIALQLKPAQNPMHFTTVFFFYHHFNVHDLHPAQHFYSHRSSYRVILPRVRQISI